MSIELAVAAAGFLLWCLISSVWKSLLPKSCDGDVRLIWREDAVHPWHEVPLELIAEDVRARMGGNVDDTTYGALLKIVLDHRPPGTANVQFAVVLTTGVHPNDVLFVSDVHPARGQHHEAIAAAPLLIGRWGRARTANAVS